jgi:hypothetical protein
VGFYDDTFLIFSLCALGYDRAKCVDPPQNLKKSGVTSGSVTVILGSRVTLGTSGVVSLFYKSYTCLFASTHTTMSSPTVSNVSLSDASPTVVGSEAPREVKEDVPIIEPATHRPTRASEQIMMNGRSTYMISNPVRFVRVLKKSEYDAHREECFRFARLDGNLLLVMPDEWTCASSQLKTGELQAISHSHSPHASGSLIVRTTPEGPLYVYEIRHSFSIFGGVVKELTPDMLKPYTPEVEKKCQIM